MTRPIVADRVAPFGTSIFAEMTALAVKHQAVNLAQGFPDFDGPAAVKQAAIDAINAGHSQYARMIGVLPLNAAIAASWNSRGLEFDGDACVTVTTGCTEAIPATMLGLLNPGDEIILFEPFYDSYRANVSICGAIPRFVRLSPPASSDAAITQFTFDESELRNAFSNRTRAILINTPHNPTGKVFSREELSLIADLCIKHNTLAITDEVYENLVYESDTPHVSLASLPGMWNRTVTLSSLGKTYSFTGWKIGWAVAPPHLSIGIRAAHQFLTFGAATPLQHAAAAAINAGTACVRDIFDLFKSNRAYLSQALRGLGFKVYTPPAGYFVMADHTAFGLGDDRAFCRHMVEKIGVAAIPPSVFYEDPTRGHALVRFAFCKKRQTLEAAVAKLAALRP